MQKQLMGDAAQMPAEARTLANRYFAGAPAPSPSAYFWDYEEGAEGPGGARCSPLVRTFGTRQSVNWSIPAHTRCPEDHENRQRRLTSYLLAMRVLHVVNSGQYWYKHLTPPMLMRVTPVHARWHVR